MVHPSQNSFINQNQIIMKTIKSVTLALFLLVGTIASANNSVEKKGDSPTIYKEISELLQNPNFSVDENSTAIVKLFVNSEGELIVISVKTENETLEKFVKSSLNYHKLDNKIYSGKEFILPVTLTAE